MAIALITGSSGLIGSESVKEYSKVMDKVIGIDNDFRSYFFGKSSSNKRITEMLISRFPNFLSYNIDIRSYESLEKIFSKYRNHIELIIHTAAQPSHDWAALEPQVDFSINANGTLNLLELMKKFCPKSTFIYTSTNKVYGDAINYLDFEELKYRFEINKNHKYHDYGIDENFNIDNSLHSLFGVSKLSGDLLVQEYGKYFKLNTGVFRGGCLTGGHQSGAEMHGFLNYLVKCNLKKISYTIHGYSGKQVRDNIHASDLVNAFMHFHKKPMKGDVFNIGGSRFSNCSVLEAMQIIEKKTNIKFTFNLSEKSRTGDHKWWVSDIRKFKNLYQNWTYKKNLEDIIDEIIFYYRNN